jgi:predicted aspartyl protease
VHRRYGLRWSTDPSRVVCKTSWSLGVARLRFELVGGARMTANVALGEIEWLGERLSVEVILSEGNDALIGTELFAGSHLVVDYSRGLVTISRDD